MLKQFELTQIGSVAPKENETLFELDKDGQSLVERIKGALNFYRNDYLDVTTPDRLQNTPDVSRNGVTKLF